MGHFLLTKVCLLIKHGPLHNPLRGRQTLQRWWSWTRCGPNSRFNPLRGRQTLQRGRWKARRAGRRGFNPLRGRQTLQPPAAPPAGSGPARFNPLRGRQTLQRRVRDAERRWLQVSILYEADRLCNLDEPGLSNMENTQFQSSTRQTDFATPLLDPGQHCEAHVSILYEADRLCNRLAHYGTESYPMFQSSTRQTDFATLGRPGEAGGG